MPRDIGPEMLAHLEAKRPAMDPATYQARRIEIEDLIRRGKAVEFAAWEQVARVLLVVLGLGLALAMAERPLVGLVTLAVCLLGARYWGRLAR